MAMKFEIYQRTDRKELGTIAEIGGKGGSVRPANLKNWTDESKRIVLVIARKDGTSATATCSEQVTARLRSKELKLSQVLGLTVVEQKTRSGEIANVVVMPNSGATLPAVEITDSIPTYQPVSTVSIEDLIAF
jgi:hypothetical protein